MKFVLTSILLIFIVLFSTIVIYRSCQRYSVSKLLLWLLISFASFFICFPLVVFALNFFSMRIIIWYFWASFLIYIPLFSFSSFYCVDKCVGYFKKREFKLFRYIGAIVSAVALYVIISGMAYRHNIEIREFDLIFNNLPQKFNNTKIVHITDLHLGCLYPEVKYLDKIERLIAEQNPDLLVFTGDMFNTSSKDGQGYGELFTSIKPSLGKFIVLGNHDYGTYAGLKSKEDIEKNLSEIENIVNSMGFTLLRDSSVVVSKDGDSINIVGIEHCGNELFPCYSDLSIVKTLFQEDKFNLLLAHDPAYWNINVSKGLPFADLTLSGHTHSAQFGIEIGDKKYSPSSLLFDHWEGSYSKYNEQNRLNHLHISRGLGYVGIPFRFGLRPEITVINLIAK